MPFAQETIFSLYIVALLSSGYFLLGAVDAAICPFFVFRVMKSVIFAKTEWQW